MLAQAYPDPVRRRRAVGVWAAVSGAALVAGPVVGGELVARHGWPSVFWVNVPLCLLVLLLLLPTPLPQRSSPSGRPQRGEGDQETKIADEERARLDVPGAVLSCLMLGGASYGIVLLGRHGISWKPTGPLALAVVAALVLVVVERRSAHPLLPRSLLADRRFRGATLAAFAAALAVFVLMVFVSLFLQVVLDHDPREAGKVLLALPFALVITAALTSRWHAVVVPVAVGLVLAGAGLLGLAAAVDLDVSDRTVALWLVVVGIGVGLTTAPVVATTLAAAGERRSGLASACVTVARELGGVVAVAGLGAIAVARLTSRLTDSLVGLGVPGAARQPLLDSLLRADKPDVRRQLIDAVGVEKTLGAYQRFQTTATDSFATSTRWVLGTAGLTLLVLAVASAWLLGSDHRGEGVEEG